MTVLPSFCLCVQVVRSLLMSLAHHEIYYSIFNEFVGQNLSVLDEDGFSFMKHCMALLSFDNKQAWLKAKLQKLRSEHYDILVLLQILVGIKFGGRAQYRYCHNIGGCKFGG